MNSLEAASTCDQARLGSVLCLLFLLSVSRAESREESRGKNKNLKTMKNSA